MFHPYQDGYSVLPALRPWDRTESPFCVDARLAEYLAEKSQLRQRNEVFLEAEMDDRIYDAFAEIAEKHAPQHVQPPWSFDGFAMQVQEDIAIHRIQAGRDWLAATHICFPSSWRPEEKIGKPLAEIHQPIPGMNLKNSYKLAETMVNRGPFVRYVWSPIFEDRFNYHPDLPCQPLDANNPTIYVKVERQITWGIPELGAALFILRQFVIKDVDYVALHRACANMNAAERAYKGVDAPLLAALWKLANER